MNFGKYLHIDKNLSDEEVADWENDGYEVIPSVDDKYFILEPGTPYDIRLMAHAASSGDPEVLSMINKALHHEQ